MLSKQIYRFVKWKDIIFLYAYNLKIKEKKSFIFFFCCEKCEIEKLSASQLKKKAKIFIKKLLLDLNPVPADWQSDDLHTELQSKTLKLINILARTIL